MCNSNNKQGYNPEADFFVVFVYILFKKMLSNITSSSFTIIIFIFRNCVTSKLSYVDDLVLKDKCLFSFVLS